MTNEQVDIKNLIGKLEQVRSFIIEQEKSFPTSFFDQIHPTNEKSARNLINYLAMRSFDLRPVQEELTTLGLSSLSHAERFTRVNIDNILHILYKISGEESSGIYPETPLTLNYPAGRKLLNKNTEAIFGPSRRSGSRIMVTMPLEAAQDPQLVEKLVGAGMDVARINCSHAEEDTWEKMIRNIRKAAEKQGRPCLIYMDLPGPKLRTGPINPELEGKKKKAAAIRLFSGDKLHIYRKTVTGDAAKINEQGKQVKPAQISITLPEIWDDVQVGHSIFFDDGKIGGEITHISEERMEVLITRARPGKGSKLRSDKGINLPETDLSLPPLTDYDLKILPFISRNADMVGYSFVRKPSDVHQLQQHLKALNKEDLPIILKIETREAFRNLPELLLESMRSSRFGVMLARGDLAIEVGFTRIAEVQEQILWLCDAAHVPIIWATQVLENLLKEGLASRAEITDAAMSVRAECVMLNKGPFIREAVETLANIDERMIKHMFKKHGALRPLNVATGFFEKNQIR